MRKGDALFAMESFEEALKTYNLALGMSPTEDATRAKIFNNIGVVQYYMNDLNQALRSLTSALEIQRQWLDGSIRRESIVYDSSVTLENMGKVYLRKKDFELSYFVYEEACMVRVCLVEGAQQKIWSNLYLFIFSIVSKSHKTPFFL